MHSKCDYKSRFGFGNAYASISTISHITIDRMTAFNAMASLAT